MLKYTFHNRMQNESFVLQFCPGQGNFYTILTALNKKFSVSDHKHIFLDILLEELKSRAIVDIGRTSLYKVIKKN